MRFLPRVSAALGATFAVAACSSLVPTVSVERPLNVLVIVTDDQRAGGTLEIMEETRQWFAEAGTRYPNAYATTPLCCPFRASLFTGRYAHNHGVRLNLDPTLLDQEQTIQHFAQEAGYQTAMVGKYLNRWPIEDPPPYFDRYAFFTPEVGARQYTGALFNTDGQVGTIDEYSTSYIADKALEYLDHFEGEADQQPWLMFVAPFAPHVPSTPEEAYVGTPVPRWKLNPGIHERSVMDKPDFYPPGRNVVLSQVAEFRELQLRTLMSVDDLVAEIASALERLDEESNTLAFFMSDGGYLWGEHGLSGKRLPYRESIRIPFFIKWPDTGRPPVDDRIVANIDVAPTIVDVLEMTGAEPMDGRSVLASQERDRILIEFWANPNRPEITWRSSVTPESQYIEYYAQAGSAATFAEYYDLERDPHQLVNPLGDAYPGNDLPAVTVDAMSRRLAADFACAAGSCP